VADVLAASALSYTVMKETGAVGVFPWSGIRPYIEEKSALFFLP
jgi:hypothetical protein